MPPPLLYDRLPPQGEFIVVVEEATIKVSLARCIPYISCKVVGVDHFKFLFISTRDYTLLCEQRGFSEGEDLTDISWLVNSWIKIEIVYREHAGAIHAVGRIKKLLLNRRHPK